MRRSRACLAVLLTVASVAATGKNPEPPVGAESLRALDLGFRFASALEVDPKDQGMAQQGVVLEAAALGAIDAAVRQADAMHGWRQGSTFAGLALEYARSGRQEEARNLLRRAEVVQASTAGWQGVRIGAQIAEARAALGERARAEELAAALAAADAQYAAQATAIAALAQAASGAFEEAFARLATLAGEQDFEPAWWRTDAYVQIARLPGAPAAVRGRALEEARLAAQTIPGWKQAEVLATLASEYRGAGNAAAARETVLAAERLGAAYDDSLVAKGTLLALTAQAWGSLGETERAVTLLKQADLAAAQAMLIDRPGVEADLAAAWFEIGGVDEARRRFGAALDRAAALANSRPRALAMARICRALARCGAGADAAMAGRLEGMLAGLGDPW